MACLTHTCRECGAQWFDNDESSLCPNGHGDDQIVESDEVDDEREPVWDGSRPEDFDE